MTAMQLEFNPKAPFILVDGSSYLFRAFHAMPPLTNSKGHATGAIFGVINMIGKLLEQYQPERIAVVFDAKGKNFRHEMYEEYKAHRPPMPDELRIQIEPIHQIIKALGIPLLVIDGVEADDVMGTLAQQATEAKMDALLSTGDKDMAQLVNEHITLINTMNDTLMTPEKVLEKFHVKPEQIIDYLALMGDSSDNIPGIPKCGPKTAAKWLEEYGTIENLINHADEIKGKIGESLRDNLDQLKLSQQLTTIRIDCDLPVHLSDIKRHTPDVQALAELFAEYDLRNWQGQIAKGQLPFSKFTGRKAHSATLVSEHNGKHHSNPAQPATSENFEIAPYETILDESTFEQWLTKLKEADCFAIDTETTSLDTMIAQIVGISFAYESSGKIHAAYVPLKHDYEGAPNQLDFEQALSRLKPILESEQIQKVGQNLKYDWHVFMNHGIELKGIAYDTMLESYCLNSVATRHNMDDLALKYLNHSTIHFEDIAGKGKNQLTFNQIPVEQAAPYAAEDADITLRLHFTIWPQLKKDEGPCRIFKDIEMPLLTVLAKTERNGVLIDKQMLADQSYEIGEKLVQLEQDAHLIAGTPFNLNSSKQLQEVLFDRLNLPVLKKTPKGQPSTAEPVLAQLADEGHELPTLILEYRSLAKLKSTYTDSLPKQINEKTGRVHTSYQQAVASTGRLSSTEPNLQNIPVRNAEGRRIRQAFIAPKGYKIVAADYSQIELRIMAHLSGDANLVTAFTEGKDIHQATAAEIFGMPLESVTSEQRRSAKAVNFGLIYGMSAFGLAKQLNIPRNLAQEYINLYFSRYPSVQTYMESTQANARENGYVETLLGRRLYLPDINAKNGQLRQYAERTAINAPMQGTAADIIKRAMIDIQKWLDTSDLNLKMLMQVHDELVFEVAEKDIEAAQPEIKRIMEAALSLDVPLIVEVGQGDNWDEAH
ncbi:DNA polymerase I [Hydrogenovibrio marinus]|uniref:DNA polymerase I n=1 Tax=Hydrogenovibrio marinus TaxID=28885 RepID=A0A066ZQG8_HYDMR|nr:DNA polymerase I [Hydrogenovibrio marinus]KDN96058.1 DNA polymerase I [Hydrogenovibrio marinus]BBN58446.1 DNA polymerase I [Hydrogenovibrio marinus]